MPPRPEGQPPFAFSNGVLAGKTLYVSGHTSGKPTGSAAEEAKVALDGVKSAIDAAGMSMDDLVWVQVFCTDLSLYNEFNAVYRTYFKGPLPARAFLGTDKLLGEAHFEVMGIAVKK
jgi:2-iminobutanoate/2-iminopropanoate deaminase